MQQEDQGEGPASFFNSGQTTADLRSEKRTRLLQVMVILAMLALMTVLNIFLEKIIHPSSLVFIYLVPTIASAIYFGTWAAVLSFAAGFLIFDFLFVTPHYTFYISKPQDIYNVSFYLVTAVLMTYLITLVRRQTAFLKARLDRVSLIEDMSRDFLLLTPVEPPSPGPGIPESLQTRALSQLGQLSLRYTKMVVPAPAFVFFREHDEGIQVRAQSSLDLEISEKDRAAAVWTLEHGASSGSGTHSHLSLIHI
jgi:K+-sensing histidine kinase KdpD